MSLNIAAALFSTLVAGVCIGGAIETRRTGLWLAAIFNLTLAAINIAIASAVRP